MSNETSKTASKLQIKPAFWFLGDLAQQAAASLKISSISPLLKVTGGRGGGNVGVGRTMQTCTTCKATPQDPQLSCKNLSKTAGNLYVIPLQSYHITFLVIFIWWHNSIYEASNGFCRKWACASNPGSCWAGARNLCWLQPAADPRGGGLQPAVPELAHTHKIDPHQKATKNPFFQNPPKHHLLMPLRWPNDKNGQPTGKQLNGNVWKAINKFKFKFKFRHKIKRDHESKDLQFLIHSN